MPQSVEKRPSSESEDGRFSTDGELQAKSTFVIGRILVCMRISICFSKITNNVDNVIIM